MGASFQPPRTVEKFSQGELLCHRVPELQTEQRENSQSFTQG